MAEVKFYDIPQHQYENSCYVIGGTTENNLTHIATGVKIKEYDNIRFKCPNHEGIHKANVCTIDGWVHDILEVEINTLDSPSCEVLVSFNPVSNLPTNARLAGFYQRAPARGDFYVDRLPLEFDTSMSKVFFMPFIDPVLHEWQDTNFNTGTPLYVQIVATQDAVPLGGGKPPDKIDGNITTYCTFNQPPPLYAGSPRTATGIAFDNDLGPAGEIITDHWARPEEIFRANEIDIDTVLGVYASTRCPWRLTLVRKNGRSLLKMVRGSGENVENLSYFETKGLRKYYANMDFDPPMYKGVVAQVMVDEAYRYYGKFSIQDEMGNTVGHIPNWLFTPGQAQNLYYRTYSDITGLYTKVSIEKDGYMYDVALFPEGQLPWAGDNWKLYMSRSMDSDRQALNHSIEMANEQFKLDVMEGGANALLTAGIGGSPVSAVAGLAQFGVSAFAGSRRAEMGKNDLLFQQELAEGRIKNSPAAHYETSYGGGYFQRRVETISVDGQPSNLAAHGGAGLVAELPQGLTPIVFNNYILTRGWPINRGAQYDIQPGYYRGELWDAENVEYSGMRMKKLRDWFRQGFRVIV